MLIRITSRWSNPPLAGLRCGDRTVGKISWHTLRRDVRRAM